MLTLRSVDGEDTVRAPADVFHLLAGMDLESRPVMQLLPKPQQLFLGDLQLVELAVERELDRARQHQLLAWILRHRAAELVLLERDVSQFPLDGSERGADAAR